MQNRSNGKTGETMAEYFFKKIGWKMFRHQPRTVIARSNGKPFTIQCRSDGVADFTGFENIMIGQQMIPIYRACEIKEAHGDTMPASRVRKEQRDWLIMTPFMCAYIAICWLDGQPKIELFRPIEKGSYKKGEGLILK
jgi:hypothetical protein